MPMPLQENPASGFTAKHKEDATFAFGVKCICALVFIPTEHVLDAFEVMIMIYRMILRSFCRILKILAALAVFSEFAVK